MLSHKNFINIAYEISSASNCVSRKTWAVIVKDWRVVSTWYNGTPPGYENCSDYWKWEYTKDHHEWSYKYEIHAEMNAIVWAARRWISTEGATLYCTYEPCFDCTRAILASWISHIFFSEKYKHHTNNELGDFIKNCKCTITHIPRSW